MDKLYVLIKEQFPEFVQSDYPRFIEFIQAYYKWFETQLPVDLKQIVDIDNTPDNYLRYFIKQLDVYGLFNDARPYNKLFIRNIKQLYTSKGTEQGLLLLLKAVYDSNVTIDHPIQYVLKPSDGTWIQEKFITLKNYSGDLANISEWDFSYDCRCAGRNQPINITRVELIDQETVRFYYQQQTSTILFVGQRINVYNKFGAILFIGTIVPSPSKIEVLEPGKDWREGQVIVWPGSIRNTVIRVASVDSEGSIKRIEVVDYGFNHSNGEAFIASPYPSRPSTTSSSLTQTPVGLINNYTLEIVDAIDEVTDSVQGYVAGIKYNPYFLENYLDGAYMGQLLFNNTTILQPSPVSQTNISVDTWSASRTKLLYVFDTVASLRGRWLDESSHISTDSIRLQDSFYYQQYSYVIESDVNPSIYKDLAAAVHLAGTKYFTKFNATSQFKLETSVTVTFPFVTLNVSDVSLVADSHNVEITRQLVDNTIPFDDIHRKGFAKRTIAPDSTSVTDVSFRDFDKFRFDLLTSLDDITGKSFIKLNESAVITDSNISNKEIKIQKPQDDVSAAEDLIKSLGRRLESASLGSFDGLGKNNTYELLTLLASPTDTITQRDSLKFPVDDVLADEALTKDISSAVSSFATPQDDLGERGFAKRLSDDSLGSFDVISKGKSITYELLTLLASPTDTITQRDSLKFPVDDVLADEALTKDISSILGPDGITTLDQLFKGTSVDVQDTALVIDIISNRPIKIFDNTVEAIEVSSKTTAKYTTDEVLTQEVSSKRSTKPIVSTVIAFSPDTSSEETLEYFASDYIEYPSRYALVSVTTTIPE